MVLEAGERGCLREVLVIAAALSIQDPRERPAEQRERADQFHARFNEGTATSSPSSTSGTTCAPSSGELSGNRFRRMCRDEHLNFLRIREWADVHSQLRTIVADLGLTQNREEAEPDRGPPGAAGRACSATSARRTATPASTSGARNARFSIFPGSSLSKKPPAWVMAAELVETSRLFARTVARIEPEWAEELGAHLVKRSYSEPHWSAQAGQRHGPRAGDALRAACRDRPARAPRADRPGAGPRAVHPPRPGRGRLAHAPLDVPPQPRAAVRGRRSRAPLPPARPRRRRGHPRTALRRAPAREGGLGPSLRLVVEEGAAAPARPADLHRRRPPHRAPADDLDEDDFPAVWEQGPLVLGLSYLYEPGSPDDGVAVHVPVGRAEPAPARRLRVARARSPGGARHRRWCGRCPRSCAATWCRCPTTSHAFLDEHGPGRRAAAARCSRATWAGPRACPSPSEAWDLGSPAAAPADDVPGRGRRRRGARRVEGPGPAPAAPRPRRAPGVVRGHRFGFERHGLHRLGPRRAAPQGPPHRRRPLGRGLPGARRRGRLGRAAPGRLHGRAGAHHVAGRAPAVAAHRAAVDEGRAGPADQRHPPRPRGRAPTGRSTTCSRSA